MKQFTCSNSKMPIWVDFVPSCWDMTKVKFIAKVVPGATPKSTIASFWNGDIPFVTPADYVTEDHYVGHWARTITEEGMNSCSTSLLPSNSVIVSNRAPIGLVAINKIPVCTNQGCKGLVIKSREYSPEYLYRLLSVADDALNALGNGTTYQELSGKALSDFVIPKPPLDVQRSIVAFLDSRCKPIDEAIARHRLIIDKLEDYRKAVITKAVTKGLDESAPMKDSGIEWIGSMPANWSTTKLKFLCMSHNGVDYNSQDLCNQNDDNSLFVIRSSNLVNGAVVHGDDVYINKPVPKNMLLRKGDLVIVRTNGSRRLVGKCALVTKNEKATAGAFMLICRSSLNPYIYWVLNSSLLSFHRGHFDTTTINQMSNEMLKNMIIPLPPHEQMIDIMTYLDYKCAAINEGVNRQEQVIARLEEYRRSLIFHAVTGRIDCTGGAR